MDSQLHRLLSATATERDSQHGTHVTLFPSVINWEVNVNQVEDFWSGYCNLVETYARGRFDHASNWDSNMCLAERCQDVMPVVAELCLRFDSSGVPEQWEPYYEDFLALVAYCYQSVIDEYFRITEDTGIELLVVVLETDTWVETGDDGRSYSAVKIRLQFPYARTDVGTQVNIIRPRVIQLLRSHGALTKLHPSPIGDWEQLITRLALNSHLLMYGSTEVEGRPKYQISHIWSRITWNDLEDDQLSLPEIELVDAFVPTNHSCVQQQAINQNIILNREINFWLPMFLSIGHWNVELKIKQNLMHQAPIRESPMRIFGLASNRNRPEETDLQIAERMIMMLSSSRFFNENFWLDIGQALYTADRGGDNGIIIWIRSTENSLRGVSDIPTFLKDDAGVNNRCRALYQTFFGTNITVKTLAWYARQDAPDRYQAWHKEWCLIAMERAVIGVKGVNEVGLHADVAVALYRVHWLDFVYYPGKQELWYNFSNHRWVQMDRGIDLTKVISKGFANRFEAIRASVDKQIAESSDEGLKSSLEATTQRIGRLIVKLKNGPYGRNILAQAKHEFKVDNFQQILDTNVMLLGMTNGVLEVAGHHIIFRPAKPEDYISMCTTVPFNINFTWDTSIVRECMEWFRQVFVPPELLHYFLKFVASCIPGRNRDKIFPMWIGCSNGSKSTVVKGICGAFGMYAVRSPVSMMSEKTANSGNATPQLARLKGVRINFLSEPEEEAVINKGWLKDRTGGEKSFVRNLYSDGFEIEATDKMIVQANQPPLIGNPDIATRNRVRVFPFLSCWVDDPPATIEEQYAQRRFKKDPNFENKIKSYAPAIIWILTQYYPYYATEGLAEPEIVTRTTLEYWQDNDVYAQFTADYVQPAVIDTPEGPRSDPNARISLTEIYAEFKAWFKESFPGADIPDRPVAKREFTRLWGPIINGYWSGVRMNNAAQVMNPMDIFATAKRLAG